MDAIPKNVPVNIQLSESASGIIFPPYCVYCNAPAYEAITVTITGEQETGRSRRGNVTTVHKLKASQKLHLPYCKVHASQNKRNNILFYGFGPVLVLVVALGITYLIYRLIINLNGFPVGALVCLFPFLALGVVHPLTYSILRKLISKINPSLQSLRDVPTPNNLVPVGKSTGFKGDIRLNYGASYDFYFSNGEYAKKFLAANPRAKEVPPKNNQTVSL